MATTPVTINDRGLTTPATIDNIPTDTLTNGMEPYEAIDAAAKYLSLATALVGMNPLETHSLMRFTDAVSQENKTSKADTLIDTAASLNFVSKKFLNANGFYKYCKSAPKIVVRVANEQRIATNKIFCRTVFTIDGEEFTGLLFGVLPYF